MGNTIDSCMHHTAGRSEFTNVFDSVQLCFYYVLYYNCDFSKQKIKNLNAFLHEMNETVTEREVYDIYKHMTSFLKIDTEKLAKSFPDRVKLRMCKKKMKCVDPLLIMGKIHEAIDLMSIFMMWTLHEHYRFSAAKLEKMWEEVVEFSRMYANKDPLLDSHLIKYFEIECGLTIEMR